MRRVCLLMRIPMSTCRAWREDHWRDSALRDIRPGRRHAHVCHSLGTTVYNGMLGCSVSLSVLRPVGHFRDCDARDVRMG